MSSTTMVVSTPLPSAPGLSKEARRRAYEKLCKNIEERLPQELKNAVVEELLFVTLPPEHYLVDIPSPTTYHTLAFPNIQLEDELTNYEKHVIYVTPRLYKPPVGLQLNRFLRNQCAKFYYPNFTFYVGTEYDGLDACRSWLGSLTPEHRKLITTVKIASVCRTEPSLLNSTLDAAAAIAFITALAKWDILAITVNGNTTKIADLSESQHVALYESDEARQGEGMEVTRLLEPRQIAAQIIYDTLTNPLQRGWWRGDGTEIGEDWSTDTRASRLPLSDTASQH